MDREELLRSARNLYENPGTNEALKVVLEDTYPELKESEDERIRKMLIDVYKRADMGGEIFGKGITYKQVIAWLEKQKEQKPAEWSEEDEKRVVELKTFIAKCNGFNKANRQKAFELIDSLRPQPKQESEPLEIKYAEKIYKVHGTKELPGGVVGYIIEDEPGHYDCIIHPDEVLGGGYGIKSNGSPYPTKEANFGQPHWKASEERPIKVYRVENEKEQKGLWRKFDGTWEPLFDMLTDGQCKDMPMGDSPIYREGGKQWFASAPSRETLQKWFSKKDLEELTAKGFTISEFEVVGHKKVSDFEYIFTRDNIISRTYLKVSDIYPQELPEVDLEKEANECWDYVFSAIGLDENSLMTMNHKDFLAFARHFYELGLNARKEE